MELHFSHASRVLAIRPQAIEATRLLLTGDQPKLTALFARRFKVLTKSGALADVPGRLVDRRPVEVKPEVARWNPPAKVRVKSDKRQAYDHPGLTETQRKCRTNTTKGEAMDMKNKVADEKGIRTVRWNAIQNAKGKKS